MISLIELNFKHTTGDLLKKKCASCFGVLRAKKETRSESAEVWVRFGLGVTWGIGWVDIIVFLFF